MGRRAVVSRERLILGHCLVLSILVVRTSKQHVLWVYYYGVVFVHTEYLQCIVRFCMQRTYS